MGTPHPSRWVLFFDSSCYRMLTLGLQWKYNISIFKVQYDSWICLIYSFFFFFWIWQIYYYFWKFYKYFLLFKNLKYSFICGFRFTLGDFGCVLIIFKKYVNSLKTVVLTKIVISIILNSDYIRLLMDLIIKLLRTIVNMK